MKQRLGLFGGSFNPVHKGHLHLAEAVRRALSLDGVLLMPTGEAPHKSSAEYAPAVHRYQMCCLAAEAYDWLTVSDYEMRRRGKSYTADTLRYLTQVRPETDWTLMIGSDMLLTFDSWRRWREILSMASLAAVSREVGDLDSLHRKAAELNTRCPAARITVLEAEPFPVSSTEIRGKLRQNADCSCFLPENALQYIKEHRLYTG